MTRRTQQQTLELYTRTLTTMSEVLAELHDEADPHGVLGPLADRIESGAVMGSLPNGARRRADPPARLATNRAERASEGTASTLDVAAEPSTRPGVSTWTGPVFRNDP
jgi:hypothetical protein